MEVENPISRVGPRLSINDIIWYFNGFDIDAPKDLVNFLAKANGGRPDRIQMSIQNHWDGTDNFVSLWGIKHPEPNLSYGENLRNFRHYVTQGLVPFGAADSGSLVCISIRPNDLGQIYYIDIAEADPNGTKQKSWWVAKNLVKFIIALK